jgi:hypothetical protein
MVFRQSRNGFFSSSILTVVSRTGLFRQCPHLPSRQLGPIFVAHFPTGTNTIVVTHLPNITGAFPQLASGLEDGEALIFGPDGQGQAILVTRVKIEEWPAMQF